MISSAKRDKCIISIAEAEANSEFHDPYADFMGQNDAPPAYETSQNENQTEADDENQGN